VAETFTGSLDFGKAEASASFLFGWNNTYHMCLNKVLLFLFTFYLHMYDFLSKKSLI